MIAMMIRLSREIYSGDLPASGDQFTSCRILGKSGTENSGPRRMVVGIQARYDSDPDPDRPGYICK